MTSKNSINNKLSFAGLLIAMGVVYGDIGTSPLYVMKAIVTGNGGLANISPNFIIGSVSLIFWTITLLTSIKYVLIALKADNRGEGGIFALYTLVRKKARYLIIPAMIGGASLLADGVLTPAVTVTTAIEGLRGVPTFYSHFGESQQIVIAITLAIILILFGIQRFGTDVVGRAFGPIMFAWFTFLGAVGLLNFIGDWTVIRALNPYYAFKVLFSPENKAGIFILGSVFLATTGAEALYSDLGHAGLANIRASWPYIKICLTLNYLGQAAWLLKVRNNPVYQEIEDLNPFFAMLPEGWLVFGVIFATIAAVIASQALISGSFSLVSEAIKLKLLPRLKILYPGSSIGQMYIPTINLLLWIFTSCVVIAFQTSARMEAAYGLSITITMLMTTILLHAYLIQIGQPKLVAHTLTLFFALIEGIFFISSITKFFHGGYVAVMIAAIILFIMVIWQWGNQIEAKTEDLIDLHDYLDQIGELRKDSSLPLNQTNVVFLVAHMNDSIIGRQYIYSILDKRPKKARVYWFVNVVVTDEPYTKAYEVDMMDTDYIVKVKLHLGFKVTQEINVYIRQIIHDLMTSGRLPKQPQRYTITPGREVGDFQFVIIHEKLSQTSELSSIERQVMQLKLFIKEHVQPTASAFGLDYSEVLNEYVPLVIGNERKITLTEITNDHIKN